MNYFALFNLTEEFVIDTDILEQRYQLMQRMTSPSKHANKPQDEQRSRAQKHIDVNKAYQTLKSSVSRGEHLLQVRKVELVSEQHSIADAEFLNQQSELREALANACSAAQLEQLKRDVNELLADYTDKISIYFRNNTVSDNKRAANELNKLKILNQLSADIEDRQ